MLLSELLQAALPAYVTNSFFTATVQRGGLFQRLRCKVCRLTQSNTELSDIGTVVCCRAAHKTVTSVVLCNFPRCHTKLYLSLVVINSL